jgi:hypothetical protein
MSRQESQKRGSRSEAEKQARARNGYAPLPPSNEVRGAFGGQRRKESTDQDVSLSKNVHATKQGSTSNREKSGGE